MARVFAILLVELSAANVCYQTGRNRENLFLKIMYITFKYWEV